MKRSIFAALFAGLIVVCLNAGANAQCAPKQLKFADGSDSITVAAKAGACAKYKFTVDEGQRVIVKITSGDGKARFNLQWDASDDETGTELFSNQTSLDRKMTYTDWLIWATGTAGVDFTLKITAVD